jgi:hypothetical protein
LASFPRFSKIAEDTLFLDFIKYFGGLLTVPKVYLSAVICEDEVELVWPGFDKGLVFYFLQKNLK